ncbi:hypothetical protein N9A79_00190 [Pirellulales bacterium]|nr:hypothetical protein [Pirellulales bacterium]
MQNGYRQHTGLAFVALFFLSSLALSSLALSSLALSSLALSSQAVADDLSTSDVSPAIVGSFTRAIQPLLLNRCAAGACHGGTQGTEPKLIRGPVHGHVNRKTTLMNLESVSSSVMHNAEDTQTLATILNHHNTKENKPAKNKPLLTAYEQELFVTWIASLPHNTLPEPASVKSIPDLQTQRVTPANFTQPQHQRSLAKQPNRLRRLLERAEHPPQLPLPPVTPGLQLEKLTPEEFPLLQLPFKEKKGTAKPNE